VRKTFQMALAAVRSRQPWTPGLTLTPGLTPHPNPDPDPDQVPSRDELFMRIAPSVDEDEVIELCLREVGECADTMRLVIDSMARCFDTLQLDDRRKI
jgi:hypothetical protein